MGRKKSKSRIKNVAWPWNDIPADVPDKLHIINKVISAFADELVTKFDIDNTERLGQMVNGFVDSLDFSDRYTEEFFSPLNSFWEELVATFDIKDLDNLEGVVVDFANALLELEDIWKDLDDDTSDPGHTGIEDGMKQMAISPATSRASATNCVIAVVGVTGSGKSSFIKRVTKQKDVKVGAGLFSETSEVKAYTFKHNNVTYTMIDTPGFNDTEREDYDIFQDVVKWMEKSFRAGTRLNGILYLHPITDRRMQGSALKNLNMFRKLCGEDCFKNVVLGTTFWDLVDHKTGSDREKELSSTPEFWGDMVERGSEMFRIWPDRDSNLNILRQMSEKGGVTMRIQDELVNKALSLNQTQAMQAVDDFARLDAERKRLAAAAKAEEERREHELREAEEAANHARIVRERELRKEQKKQAKQRQKVAKQMRNMERQAEERRRRELDAEIQRQANIREQQRLQDERMERLRNERQGPPYYASGCSCPACRPWPPSAPGYGYSPQRWYPR